MALLLAISLSLFASDWQKKVPESERSAANPLAGNAGASAAGAAIYMEKCSKCHGEKAEGKGHHPSLRSGEVVNATPGELHWIITHGTGIHGMPGFGKLSDTERWQLVSYIKSVQSESKGQN